jgi:HlyD family secretion protein
MTLPKRRFTWILLAAAAALVVWALWPAAVPVDTAPVTRGMLQVTVDDEGETRVRHRYVVSAPVAGRLLRVELEPGDAVRANETVLATFTPAIPAPLDARSRAEATARVNAAADAVRAARAERDKMQADLAFARRDLERVRPLVAAGAVAQERLDAAERDVRTREEALHAADFAAQSSAHQLEVARAGLLQAQGGGTGRPIPLRSPIDGVVLRVRQKSETVMNPGEPVLEVGDVGHLEIVTDLLTRDGAQVRPGQRVVLERWGGPQPLTGRVRLVEPSAFTKVSALGVEEQRVNVLIDFEEEDAASRLGDGYRLDIRIIVWERENVLKVPAGAVFTHDGRPAVFAVRDGRAVLTAIDTGRQNALEAEVLQGLHEGGVVIVYPGDRVADGVRVTPRGPGA